MVDVSIFFHRAELAFLPSFSNFWGSNPQLADLGSVALPLTPSALGDLQLLLV